MNGRLVNEIREGCDAFETVGLETVPDKVNSMVYDLTVSADKLEILTEAWAALGRQLGEIGEICASYSFDTSANSLNHNTMALNDYGNRVAPTHVSTADAWMRTL